MFNLYTYEKKLLENLKEKSEEESKRQFKIKRKKKLKELSKNYDNRMKNFIFSMCEKPIILGKKNYEDELNKTFNKKFIFGEYKTEKQRLEERESIKNKLNEYDKQRKDIEKKRNLLKVKNHRDYLLIQPEMRFTSKTKLEKIIDSIKKEDMFKVDSFDPSILGKAKKTKISETKKIQEFYNLIDKEFLNDSDIKKTIKYLNDIENYELKNRYSFKNYIAWKYFGIIANNSLPKNNKSATNIKARESLKFMGENDNEKKANNKYAILVKDDFKTHFRGSSQYIELRDLNDTSLKKEKCATARNISEINQYKHKLQYKAYILALKRANKNKKILKESIPKEELKSKTSRNIINLKRIKKISPFSVLNFTSNQEDGNKLNIKKYGLKDLNDELKKKKIMMNILINAELDNSISKDFTKKYKSKCLFGDKIKIPKDFEFDENNFSELKKDKNIKEKLLKLSNKISEDRRRANDEKYKAFIKKYSRSIFGPRRRGLKNSLDDIKAENKLDYIVIDGKPRLKSDIKSIANIIFTKCNFYNKKKKFMRKE